MTSPFIPTDPKDQREEPLANLFEVNDVYKKSKSKGLETLLNKTHPRESFSEKLNRFFSSYRLTLSAGFATSIVVAGLIAAFVFSQYKTGGNIQNLINGVNVSAAEIEIKPDNQNKLGVNPDTTFKINTKKSLTEQEIKDNLIISPAVDYNIKKLSDNQYELKPTQNLSNNQVYQFNLKTAQNTESKFTNNDLSWAFQVNDSFRVLQTLPRNKAVNVDLKTGIEISFNTDSYEDIQNYFEITPKVDGKFERRGKTTVFIPTKLSEITVYTVKIKAGLKLTDGTDKLSADHVFQFETTRENNDFTDMFNIGKPFVEVAPNELISLPFVSNTTKTKLTLDVYGFKTPEQLNKALTDYTSGVFDWSIYTDTKDIYNVAELNKISSNQVNILDGGNGQKYFNTAKSLPNGIYVLQGSVDGKSSQILLQVTGLGGYLDVTTNQSLIWLQDLETKKPAARANVNVSTNNQNLQTDDDGIVTFNTPTAKGGYYYTITSGDKRLIIPVISNTQSENFNYISEFFNDQYWSHVYTDRAIYKPNDTVKFWGFVQDRDNQNSPLQLNAKIFYNGLDPVAINSISLSQSGGFFNSQLALQNLNPGTYTLQIYDQNGKNIRQTSFNVLNYVKPTYQITATTDKKAYFVGDTAKITGSASFFENTPLKNTELKYTGSSQNGIINTGNGTFNIDYKLQAGQDEYYEPYNSEYVDIAPTKAQDAEITGSLNIKKFRYRTSVNTKLANDGSKAKIDLTLKNINLDRLNNGTAKSEDDYLDSAISNKTLKITVSEYTYTQVESGQYYDFLNKKTVKNYTQQEKYLDQKVYDNLKTDQNGNLKLEFDSNKTSFYRLQIETTDTDNAPIIIRQSIYYAPQYSSDYYFLKRDDKKFNVGDTVKTTINNSNSVSIPNSINKNFLLNTYQRGFKSYKLQNNPEFSFGFDSSFMPNVFVKGIYFDGRHFHSTFPENFVFDTDSKKLNIQINTDKQNYGIQDMVTANVLVTDQNNSPVKAKLNLSVVDEAVMAIVDNKAYTLENLYTNVTSGNYYSYLSHNSPLRFGSQRGDGGGGDNTIRKQFPDTIYFKTIETDDKGQASVQFKLPDSLTSWRITTEAITTDFQAGSSKSNIFVKKPFFVNAIINTNYLENDKPKIKISAAGDNLKNEDQIEYTLNSDSLGIKSKTYKSTGTQPVEVELPSLPTGKHKLVISGISPNNRDSIQYEFDVTSGYATKTTAQFYNYDESTKITGSADKNTTLTFSDQGKGKYYQQLLDLSSSFGDRVDQKISRQLAAGLITQNFGINTISNKTNDYSNYQTEDGAVAIYSYGDNDLDATIWSVNTLPNGFEKTRLIGYLNKVIANPTESRERKIMALFGLSSLQTGNLIDLQNISAVADLNPKEKLFVALGLQNSGDKEGARKLYQDITSKYLTKDSNSSKLNVGNNAQETAYYNLLAADLAAVLQQPEATDLFDFAIKNIDSQNPYYLQQIYFLQSILGNLQTSGVEFSYSLNGQNVEKSLAKNQTFSLNLTPELLSQLKINVRTGKLGVTSSYQTPIDTKTTNSKSLSASRKYSVNGKPTNNFNEGDQIKIELTFAITDPNLKGCVDVVDYLPSGLKPIVDTSSFLSPEQRLTQWYPYLSDGQKVSFCTSKEIKGPITYFARVVNKGAFTADSPIIQSTLTPNIYYISGQDKVTIN